MSTPIDYAGLAHALLLRIDDLVPRWLPAGVERNGRWYIGDFDGNPGESANVNMSTGMWYDNATEEKGGDLTSLYACINGVSNHDAAVALMEMLGWGNGPSQTSVPAARRSEPSARDERPEPPAEDGNAVPRHAPGRSKWVPVSPVPSGVPEPKFEWGFRDKTQHDRWVKLDAVRSWEYRFEGELFGYVARFERVSSDGELLKETIPFTWCVDSTDSRGGHRWHSKQWEAPRPLYVPATILSGNLELPVVIVEGEKCAEAGHQLLGHEFDFVCWPGGCKAWHLAAWGWLMGRTVYLWPDVDMQRERLTKADKVAGVEPMDKPLRPANSQPGMQAMVGIGTELLAKHGCTVFLCNVPAPGKVPEGWDIADAVAHGWDAAKVRGFIRAAKPFVSPDEAANTKAAVEKKSRTVAAAEEEPDVDAWRDGLLKTGTGAIRPVRENVVVALDGLPDDNIPGVSEAANVVAFNEFTNDVTLLRRAPWGSPPGPCSEVEDMLMGQWLVRKHWLPSMPRGTLEEGLRMVAHSHSYHPVRQQIEALTWDGEPRLATWLRRSCLEEDEFDDSAPLQRYLALVGTFFVMGMVARVLTPMEDPLTEETLRGPGTKFDYMLILEGKTGLRKSTLLKTLAGKYFADTGLVLGDKDSYQQLQGVWLYEIPELDAFSKADVMKIKAYVASQVDYFRASFDRRARKYPRQVVFGGTTNEDHYLSDPTGNRRFWPVRVTRLIDIPWMVANRAQLLAEAVARVMAGERMYPTPEEEAELFEPQQNLRMVENSIETKIAEYLHPLGNPSGPNSDGLLVDQISIAGLLGKIGIGIEKLGPGRYHEKQAGAALRRLGWVEQGRDNATPGRPRLYHRPKASNRASGSSAGPTQGQSTEGADDDCPF